MICRTTRLNSINEFSLAKCISRLMVTYKMRFQAKSLPAVVHIPKWTILQWPGEGLREIQLSVILLIRLGMARNSLDLLEQHTDETTSPVRSLQEAH